MLICVYENRPVCEPAVRLLIASLAAAVPGAKMRIFHNPATSGFATWVARFPGVEHRPATLPAALTYDVKPLVLLEALEDGHEQALWLDSDIIVAGDFTERFAEVPGDALIATVEALWGPRDDRGALRTRGWGMPVARTLPVALNSCAVRVSQDHVPLLREWLRLLETPEYRSAQASHWQERPPHLAGDQDVLTALVCSQAFAHVPVHILRRGRDILQLKPPLGFTLAERLRVARHGLPPFVHSQGDRPWIAGFNAAGDRGWLNRAQRAYADTSPYLLAAEHFRDQLGDASWLKPRTALGRALRKVGGRSAAATGLPLAAAFDVMYAAVRVRRLLRPRSSA